MLATVEALAPDVKRLLFIGVGCQVQALRAVERHLGLEKLYVLGTNCVDNGPREGLAKFLGAASAAPATALHYEFMQDYKVHIKHDDGRYEKVFCLVFWGFVGCVYWRVCWRAEDDNNPPKTQNMHPSSLSARTF